MRTFFSSLTLAKYCIQALNIAKGLLYFFTRTPRWISKSQIFRAIKNATVGVLVKKKSLTTCFPLFENFQPVEVPDLDKRTFDCSTKP